MKAVYAILSGPRAPARIAKRFRRLSECPERRTRVSALLWMSWLTRDFLWCALDLEVKDWVNSGRFTSGSWRHSVARIDSCGARGESASAATRHRSSGCQSTRSSHAGGSWGRRVCSRRRPLARRWLRAASFTPPNRSAPRRRRPVQAAQLPGKIVKVTKGNDFGSLMQQNLLWPKPEVARQMLETALTKLTGAPTLEAALAKVLHKTTSSRSRSTASPARPARPWRSMRSSCCRSFRAC